MIRQPDPAVARAATPSAADTNLSVRRSAARSLLASHRQLAASVGRQYLANPVLEILLELLIADDVEGEMPLSDLMARIGAAPSVTWRWIKALESDGLVLCRAATGNSGTVFLTDAGNRAVSSGLIAPLG